MRILISLLAVAVMLAAGGVLVLAQRLEAEDLRRDVIREAEAITGRSITVEGPVDLSLLPQPTLTLAGASMDDLEAPGGALRLTVDRVDLQIRTLPLLRGEIRIVGVRLVRPVLRVTGALLELPQRNADGPLLPLVGLGVGHLSVVDGQVTFDAPADADRPDFERINLELEADDRRGPFVLAGGFHAQQHGFRITARLGRITAEPSTTLQLELAAIEPGEHAARIAYRGLLLTDEELRLRGRITLGGDNMRAGLEALAGLLGRAPPQSADWLEQPYEVSGTLTTSAERAQLSELLVSIAGAAAQGRMGVMAAPTPVIDLALVFGRIDLPTQLSMDRAAAALAAQAAGWLDGTIDLTVGVLGWRDDTARRVRLTLDLAGDEEVRIEQARAILPGNTDVTFTGALDGAADEPALRGSLTGVTDDLSALLRWLDLDPEGVTLEHLRTLAFSAEVGLSPEVLRVREAEVRLDGSSIEGSMAVDLEGRRQIAAALRVDRLDLDAFWPEATPADAIGAVRGSLARGDAAVEAQIGRLSWQGLHWNEVRLEARAVDQRLSLERLSARGVAETEAELRGEVDFAAERLDLTARMSAPRPALLLRRLGLQPPIALSRIGPIRLNGTARGWRANTELELQLEAEEITAALAGDVRWPNDAPASYQLQIEASHPDYAALVRSLGAAWRQEEMAGSRFELTGRVRGEGADELAVAGSASLGQTRLTGEVTWQAGPPRPRVGARLSLGEPTLDALMPLLGLAGLRLDPAVLAEPLLGNWPTQPIALDWLGAFDGTVELTGKGGFAGERLEMHARLEDRLLTIERLASGLLDGTLQADGSLDLRRRLPQLALALSLQGVDAQRLAGGLRLPPVLEGTAGLGGEVTAIGDNPYDLMRTLTGDLEVRVDDGRILGLEIDGAGPSADVPPRISVGPAGVAVDLDAVEQEATQFAALDGRFRIRRGIAEAREVALRLDHRTARVDGLIDLLLWAADLTLLVGSGPAVEPVLKLVGPLDEPQVVRLSHPDEDEGEPPAPP